MTDFLLIIYPWTKSLHIMAVLSWMAGLFYLPRLFVYHAEEAGTDIKTDQLFQKMERKLQVLIMRPAMYATWLFGLVLVFTPGIVDWSDIWPWIKGGSVLMMTWVHFWLAARRADFANGVNELSGRTYRIMNEAPTILMIIIVVSVVIKF